MNHLFTGGGTLASFKTDENNDVYIDMLTKFKLKGEYKYIFYEFTNFSEYMTPEMLS